MRTQVVPETEVVSHLTLRATPDYGGLCNQVSYDGNLGKMFPSDHSGAVSRLRLRRGALLELSGDELVDVGLKMGIYTGIYGLMCKGMGVRGRRIGRRPRASRSD